MGIEQRKKKTSPFRNAYQEKCLHDLSSFPTAGGNGVSTATLSATLLSHTLRRSGSEILGYVELQKIILGVLVSGKVGSLLDIEVL